MSIHWHAALTCDQCGRRLLVEHTTKAPLEGTAVRLAGQHEGWACGRGADRCPDCREDT